MHYSHQVKNYNPTISELRKGPQFVKGGAMPNAETPYLEIGQRLEAVRTGFSDMSQKAWAEKHCFSPTQYSNWIKGTRRINVDAAERLCSDYGLTLDFIYRGRMDGLSETARKTLL